MISSTANYGSSIAYGTIVSSGGYEVVYSGGTANGTVISSGGTEIIQFKGNVVGSINFAGTSGTLAIANPTLPANVISGFDANGASCDQIVLAGFTYSSGDSATLGANNILNVELGGTTKTLQLDPSQNFTGVSFAVEDVYYGNSFVEFGSVPTIVEQTVGAANADLFADVRDAKSLAAGFLPASLASTSSSSTMSAVAPAYSYSDIVNKSLQNGSQIPAPSHSGFTRFA